MASVKNLKDEINYITFDLINECFAFKNFHPGRGKDVDGVIGEVVKLRNELIARANHPEQKEDQKKLKAHYRKIRTDLGKLSGLVEKLDKKA